MRFLFFLLMLFSTLSWAQEPELPIFDGHIHYSEDVWDPLPVSRVLEMLTEVGIERMLVSSTPTEGTERLYRAAPDRVVPFLRPYPSRAHRYTWFEDEAIPDYIREQLQRIPYRGIGEFHVFGDDARSPVVAEVMGIAREKQLALHAHTDLKGMRALLEQSGDLIVIWAHSGFDVPVSTLDSLLRAHKHLYLELSFREGITQDGELTQEWRNLFIQHPKRCLVGMDTYLPSRWVELPELASTARAWLAQLPGEVSAAIAYRNAERLFAK
jgi:predicted TIM-barrel fold metal-dependent hydrolase